MTDKELLALARKVKAFKSDVAHECIKCHQTYLLGFGTDASALCHGCAQEVLPLLCGLAIRLSRKPKAKK